MGKNIIGSVIKQPIKSQIETMDLQMWNLDFNNITKGKNPNSIAEIAFI